MVLIYLAVIVVLIASYIYLWFHKKFSFFAENGFVHEKPHIPMGNLGGVGKKFHLCLKISELYEKFKGQAPAFGVYFFGSADVVITDLDVIKDVLIRDFDAFHNRGFFYTRDDPLTCHLFNIEDEAWRKMRAKMSPTFTSGKMKMMFNIVLGISEMMANHLQTLPNLDMIDMKDVMANFTTDVIGNCAFGLDINSTVNPNSEFRKMGRKIFTQGTNLQIKILLLTSFKELARKFGIKFFPKEISDFYINTVKETVDYRLTNKIERHDFMDLLLKIKNTTGEDGEEGLTLNELAAQCFVFFIAGSETSSTTSFFALYGLALNQELQDKTRSEIQAVIDKHDGEITYDAMQDMKHLAMVVDESLRLYGPIVNLLRTSSEDYNIRNSSLVIPKGTVTIIPIYSIHHDPDLYPEPHKFDPERFSDENKQKRHPMARLPFGDGPRNCVGERFGLLQSKIALIKMLTTFRILPTSRTTVPMSFVPGSLVLSPTDDMWLKLEKL